MRKSSLYRYLIAIVCVLVCGCSRKISDTSHSVVGRWKVVSNQGIDVPNSFFWFTMDFIEFREDGTAWALMCWPPGNCGEIRLNKVTEYAIENENQIAFVGSCRHQDPCTGIYTLSFSEDTLHIIAAEEKLILKWAGPPSSNLPPLANGPFPTAAP